MQTRTITVYEYDELNDTAKSKARDWYREGYPDYGWWEEIFSDSKEVLAFLGFEIGEIEFTGFGVQGSGARFAADWDASKVNLAGLANHAPETAPSNKTLWRLARQAQDIATKYPTATATSKFHGHQNAHEYATHIEVLDVDEAGNYAYIVDDNGEHKNLCDLFRSCMRWVFAALETEFFTLISDDEIADTIRANDYTFRADGRPWNE